MNETIFVAGATENTGLAIAQHFAKNGWQVALSCRSEEKAQQIASKLQEEYRIKCKGYALDLISIDDIKSVFQSIENDFGGLETFVANSANLGVCGDILSITPQQYDDVMNVNAKGTFFCCQQAGILMKKKNKGAIVIIGSVHSKKAIFGRSCYAMSKGTLEALTHTMAFELGEYNIRINYLVAGAIRTNRWDGLSDEEVKEKRKNWPLGIESTGDDIANAVYYLGTDLSKTVTGTDLTVDSGLLTCLLPYNGGVK